jgi:putative DNA primase/helicase
LVPKTPHPKDLALEQELRKELPGILAWAVDGARESLEHGLKDPESVMLATKKYRLEEDLLADYVESRCIVAPDRSSSVDDLYTSYKAWCETEGTRPWAKNRFSRRLTDAGYQSGRTEKGRVKLGVALKEV